MVFKFAMVTPVKQLWTHLWVLTVCLSMHRAFSYSSIKEIKSRASPVNEKVEDPEPVFNSNNGHSALHPIYIQRLAKMDKEVAWKLFTVKLVEIEKRKMLKETSANEITLSDNSCLLSILKFLDEADEDGKMFEDDEEEVYLIRAIVEDNPLLIYKLIRRLYWTLIRETLHVCKKDNQYKSIAAIILGYFVRNKVSLITERDWNDVSQGFLRMQYIYGLNATELRFGKLHRSTTKAELYFEDCLQLAHAAINMKAPALAYQWLDAAKMSLKRKHFSKHSDKNELIKRWKNAVISLQRLANLQSPSELDKAFNGKLQETLETLLPYRNYAQCRRENFQSMNERAILKCFYLKSKNPYFFINPVRTEVLSTKPLIYQFYNFVGNSTMEHFRTIADKSIKLNRKLNPFQTVFKSVYRNKSDPIRQKLYGRLEKLTSFSLTTDQIISVESHPPLAGFQDSHYESAHHKGKDGSTKGNHLATILIFTTNSTKRLGGYTAFSKVGTYSIPTPGSILLWPSVLQDMQQDERSLHMDCPVLFGQKKVVRIQIHGYENFSCIKHSKFNQ